MMIKKTLLLCGLMAQMVVGYGQQTAFYVKENVYRHAVDLYDHQIFSASSDLFNDYYTQAATGNTFQIPMEKETFLLINAQFYKAICELKLHAEKADEPILSLTKEFRYAPVSNAASFHLGQYYFENRQFARAASFLKPLDAANFSPEQSDDYHFKLGYIYFNEANYASAEKQFAPLENHNGPYRESAYYYNGQISFFNHQYEEALRRFSSLSPTGKYAEIFPLYMGQIYLVQGKYDAVIRLVDSILSRGVRNQVSEFYLLEGSAYFFKMEYVRAAERFDRFKATRGISEETNQNQYQIGISYYASGQLDKAVGELRPLLTQKDAYAQNGLYILGLAYLKKGLKTEARSTFQLASTLAGESVLTENSLAYYTRISYDQGYYPEALQASKAFVQGFPGSASLPEIQSLQGELLLKDKNYSEAYSTLKKIEKRSPRTQALLDQASYLNGLTQFHENHFSEALTLFNEVLLHAQNKELVTNAHFWKGETDYELKKYPAAVQDYMAYMAQSLPGNRVYFPEAAYGLGYAYFKTQQYEKAVQAFKKYEENASTGDGRLGDAALRIADCYFVQKDYTKANAYYTRSPKSGEASLNETQTTDYSLFQRGMIYGLQNKGTDKIKTLQILLEKYPQSAYADQAQYELGSAYLALGNADKARVEFEKVSTHYPSSPYRARAWLHIGLIYFNANQDDKALVEYKRIVDKYPNTTESGSALAAIKNIYIQKGNINEFLNYVKRSGSNPVSETGQDSILFQASNHEYLTGNYQASLQSFTEYIGRFPSGAFSHEAHFYRAESLAKLGRGQEALPDWEYLITTPQENTFSEGARQKAASQYLTDHRYDRAIPILSILAKSAKLPANYAFAVEELANAYSANSATASTAVTAATASTVATTATSFADSSLLYSLKLIRFTGASALQKQHGTLLAGMAYLGLKDTVNAQSQLSTTIKSGKSIYAAQARLQTAEIAYNRGQYKAAQKILFDLINRLPEYDYWLARAFILLSDTYVRQGDIFQARSTLKSLVDRYVKEDDIKILAREKLSKLPDHQ